MVTMKTTDNFHQSIIENVAWHLIFYQVALVKSVQPYIRLQESVWTFSMVLILVVSSHN